MILSLNHKCNDKKIKIKKDEVYLIGKNVIEEKNNVSAIAKFPYSNSAEAFINHLSCADINQLQRSTCIMVSLIRVLFGGVSVALLKMCA